MWAVFASGRMANAKARAFAALLETELGKARFGASGEAADPYGACHESQRS
jgi:hypothetical protein